MRLVVVVALAGLAALLIAILTDSSLVAIAAIALAVIGIVLLLRDWRTERRGNDTAGQDPSAADDDATAVTVPARMSADMFAPDISAERDGPSPDARTD
ncbi:hypothetical protein MANY_37630 [Mycolicibacterium anyangense]|uniref:Uncharacterized protein n=1 Tax=Mycolicibacterium anyangense TaxID=1431246 RepID=A0A6N4W8Y2_9MYCO|nr:hypothetical protein [Mycolicibacterium anyangense]BBZ78426.1 hypothetical protein MANY_37630 [Mycolicibacterium anyangense]